MLINQAWKKYFSIRERNLESIIGRGWFQLDRRLRKDPVILRKKGLKISHLKINMTCHYEQTLLSLESIITENLMISSELTSPPNLLSKHFLDLNTPKGAAGELATD